MSRLVLKISGKSRVVCYELELLAKVAGKLTIGEFLILKTEVEAVR